MALYEVDDGHRVRLIEAKTRAGARSFAARKSISIERATPARAHQLAARNIKIEVATNEDQADAGEQTDAFSEVGNESADTARANEKA
jgi:monoamine oxidase